jgi:hypothetical protein
VQGASALEAVPSCPSDCKGRVVEKDKVVVHLGDLRLARTCCCYCTAAVPVVVLVDTGLLAHRESMASVLLELEQQYALGPELLALGLLVPFAC